MNFEGSLEYDIIQVCQVAGEELTVHEIWEALQARSIDVPEPYLAKVIGHLERIELLQSDSPITWGKRYRLTALKIPFLLNPMGFLQARLLQGRPGVGFKIPFLSFKLFNLKRFFLVWRGK